MGLITRIETGLEKLVEGPFLGNVELDGLTLEIAVKREMEREKKDLLGRSVVPHEVEVIVAPEDFGNLKPFEEALKEAIEKSIAAWIRDNDYALLDPFQLHFSQGDLEQKRFEVIGRFKKVHEKEVEEVGMKEKVAPAVPGLGELVFKDTGERFSITEIETFIGREEDCQLILPDPGISRIHAVIYYESGKPIIEDMGSKSGTRLNWEKISKKSLRDGDQISIGGKVLIYRKGPEPFFDDNFKTGRSGE